jgi:hypothetical protein
MDGTMRIELCCPACLCQFSAPPHTSGTEILRRLRADRLWFDLAEGPTFEDMVFATLLRRGSIDCPECGTAVSINEESLTDPTIDDPRSVDPPR